MKTQQTFTVLDLFSGAGGTALGFKRAGFNIIGAVDIAKDAIETYHRNIGHRPKNLDLLTLPAKQLLKEFNLKKGKLDVLVGCPPCQGFTNMVNGDGKSDPRNNLVLRYLEFVEVLYPKVVIFENVPGLKKRHGKEMFEQLLRGLSQLGYGFEVGGRELNAADYGVPQERKRIVVIAARDGVIPPYPQPTHANPAAKDFKTSHLKPWVTVGEVICHYPSLMAGEICTSVPNHHARDMGSRVLNFISMIQRPGGSRTDVPVDYWLDCHKNGKSSHTDVYGRLPLSRPAGVMTSGCTNVSKGRFVHPTQNRGITSREAASLQSFPDDFVFIGGLDSIALQIGNAVPVLLAEAIAITIRDWLANQGKKRSRKQKISPAKLT